MILYPFLTVFSSKKEKKIAFSPEEIKELRQAFGLTQSEFAKKFSLSRGLVAQWETGKKSPAEDGNKILEQLKKEIPTDQKPSFLSAPDEIKALREKLGLTRAELAKKGNKLLPQKNRNKLLPQKNRNKLLPQKRVNKLLPQKRGDKM